MSVHFEELSIGAEIARGEYGVYYNATREFDGKEYVLKLYGYSKMESDMSWILREILVYNAMSGVDIPFLVRTFNDTKAGLIPGKKFKRRFELNSGSFHSD